MHQLHPSAQPSHPLRTFRLREHAPRFVPELAQHGSCKRLLFSTDSWRRTPLHYARSTKVAETLLRYEAVHERERCPPDVGSARRSPLLNRPDSRGKTSKMMIIVFCEERFVERITARYHVENYQSLLYAAASSNRLSLAGQLLDKVADINAVAGYYGTALGAALHRRYLQMAELLLDNGASIDAVGETYGLKIVLSQFGGNVGEEAAAACGPPLRYGSALAAAAARNQPEFINLFVDRGADVNALIRNGEYGSALVTAAATSSAKGESIKCLVDRGADVNMPVPAGKYGSALIAAASRGQIRAVWCLVEKHADVTASLETGEYGDALMAAAAKPSEGHFIVPEYLIERGARADQLFAAGEYGSALVAAAACAQIKAVQFLVEKGADVGATPSTGRYGSALAAAATKGHRGVLKFLIEKGAQVNQQLAGGEYGSALSAAAAWGRLEAVRYLVDQGAQVNLLLTTGDYGSALTAATARNQRLVVRFVVERGASVGRQLWAGKYGSALAAAAHWGWVDCVQILLFAEAPVDVRLRSGQFGTALKAAREAISDEDQKHAWWDKRKKQDGEREKAAVAELLQSHSSSAGVARPVHTPWFGMRIGSWLSGLPLHGRAWAIAALLVVCFAAVLVRLPCYDHGAFGWGLGPRN